IRTFDLLRRRGIEYCQYQATYWCRRQHAVGHQIIEGRITRNPLIDSIGLDEIAKRLKSQAQFLDEWCEPLKDRVNCLSLSSQSEFVVEPVEQCESVALRLVTYVIGEAGKCVDGHQLGSNFSRQKPRSDGK